MLERMGTPGRIPARRFRLPGLATATLCLAWAWQPPPAAADEACARLFDCVQSCATAECFDGCFAHAPPEAASLLGELSACLGNSCGGSWNGECVGTYCGPQAERCLGGGGGVVSGGGTPMGDVGSILFGFGGGYEFAFPSGFGQISIGYDHMFVPRDGSAAGFAVGGDIQFNLISVPQDDGELDSGQMLWADLYALYIPADFSSIPPWFLFGVGGLLGAGTLDYRDAFLTFQPMLAFRWDAWIVLEFDLWGGIGFAFDAASPFYLAGGTLKIGFTLFEDA